MSVAAMRVPVVHELKCWPSYFQAVLDGVKPFEIRRDDRGGFRTNDILHLLEWNPDSQSHTGRKLSCRVTYVYVGGGQDGVLRGFVVLGLQMVRLETGGAH